jgi:hypothetical protein
VIRERRLVGREPLLDPVGERVAQRREPALDPPLGQRELVLQLIEPLEVVGEFGEVAGVARRDVDRDVPTGREIEARTRRVGALRAEAIGRDVDFEPEVPRDPEVLPATLVGPALDETALFELPEVIDHCLRTHAERLADLGDVTRPPREQPENSPAVFVAEEIEQRR